MLNVRQHTGASIVAIVRGKEKMINPPSKTVLCAGDRLAVVGTDEQRHTFIAWLHAGEQARPVDDLQLTMNE
jgi:K+/H+ antiporter YhaU regulatory subunit KhtT